MLIVFVWVSRDNRVQHFGETIGTFSISRYTEFVDSLLVFRLQSLIGSVERFFRIRHYCSPTALGDSLSGSNRPLPRLVCAFLARRPTRDIRPQLVCWYTKHGGEFAETINRLSKRASRHFHPLNLRGEVPGFLFITSNMRTQAQHLLMRLTQRCLNLRSLTILRGLQRHQTVSRKIGNSVRTE